jgi:hypothetical protein
MRAAAWESRTPPELIRKPGLETDRVFYGWQIVPVKIKMIVCSFLEEPMTDTQSQLDQILDEIASLSLEEEEMLLHIIRQRHIERKREQILKDSRETMPAYNKGLIKRGTVSELMKGLGSD